MRFKTMFAVALGTSLFLASSLASSLAWAGLEQGHSVKTVKFAGAEIHLEDGSIWKVPSRSDWEITYNWLPGQPLAIRDGKSLVNLNSGEEIDVQRVKGPGQPAPAPGAASGPVKVPTVTSRGVVTKLETPAPAQSSAAAAAAAAKVSTLEKRTESLEDKLQVLDWRLRRIEDALKIKPQP